MDDVHTSTDAKPSEHRKRENKVEITLVVKKPKVNRMLATFSDNEIASHMLNRLHYSRPFRRAFRRELKKRKVTMVFDLKALIEWSLPLPFRNTEELEPGSDDSDSAVPSVPTDDKVAKKQDSTAKKQENVAKSRNKGKSKVIVKEERKGSEHGKGKVGAKEEQKGSGHGKGKVGAKKERKGSDQGKGKSAEQAICMDADMDNV